MIEFKLKEVFTWLSVKTLLSAGEWLGRHRRAASFAKQRNVVLRAFSENSNQLRPSRSAEVREDEKHLKLWSHSKTRVCFRLKEEVGPIIDDVISALENLHEFLTNVRGKPVSLVISSLFTCMCSFRAGLPLQKWSGGVADAEWLRVLQRLPSLPPRIVR